MKIKDFPFLLYRFDTAKSDTTFTIQSSGKKVITNGTYLDTLKGEGGHIVGFLRYSTPNENKEEAMLEYTSLRAAKSAFADAKHPDLIILHPGVLMEMIWDKKLVESDVSKLEDTIQPSPDVVKFACLGCMMTPANTAEIDFVGDATISAIVIRNAWNKSYEELKSKLDAIYSELYVNGRAFNFDARMLSQEIPVGRKRRLKR